MTARAIALDTLRALSTDELAAHLREQRGQLFQVRLQQTIGQVENHRQIRAIRKEIARTMTVQVEYRLAAERGEEPPAPKAPATKPRRERDAAAKATPAPSRRRSRAAAAEPVAEAEPLEATVVGDEPAEGGFVEEEPAVDEEVEASEDIDAVATAEDDDEEEAADEADDDEDEE